MMSDYSQVVLLYTVATLYIYLGNVCTYRTGSELANIKKIKKIFIYANEQKWENAGKNAGNGNFQLTGGSQHQKLKT